jgi:hypothetical protein
VAGKARGSALGMTGLPEADWLFGTAEMPEGQPRRLGFEGMDRFPKSLVARITYPLSRRAV